MSGRWRVAIVGPGRAGTAVALGLQRAGHRVVAVAGGEPASRAAFVGRLAGVREVADPVDLPDGVDLVVIATPDRAVADVVSALAAHGTVAAGQHLVHLAGSLGLAPLHRAALAGARVAAVHPAQTIPMGAGPDALVGAAWAVTAAAADRDWAHELVRDLGGDPHDIADDDRVLYHAALTVGSNAVAAATSTARQLLLGVGVARPEAFLHALAHRSVDNVLAAGGAALTGPVVRGDVDTVRAHLAALTRDAPPLAAAYRHLARAILVQATPGLEAGVVAALTDALAHEEH